MSVESRLPRPAPRTRLRRSGFVRQATALEQRGDLAGAQDALAQALSADPSPPVVLALVRLRSKLGLLLEALTSALLYEMSSNANAQRVLGPKGALVPSFAPLYGTGNAVVGATGGVGGRF